MTKRLLRIKDEQTGGYFAGGVTFETLDEVRAQLASYHSVDVESTEKMSLTDLCELGHWSVHDEQGNPVDTQIPVPKPGLRQALYAASPFDLCSDNDNLYRSAIDSVLDKTQ